MFQPLNFIKLNEVSKGVGFCSEISTAIEQKHYQSCQKLSLSGWSRDQMFCYKFSGSRWFATALCHLCTSDVCRVKTVFWISATLQTLRSAIISAVGFSERNKYFNGKPHTQEPSGCLFLHRVILRLTHYGFHPDTVRVRGTFPSTLWLR